MFITYNGFSNIFPNPKWNKRLLSPLFAINRWFIVFVGKIAMAYAMSMNFATQSLPAVHWGKADVLAVYIARHHTERVTGDLFRAHVMTVLDSPPKSPDQIRWITLTRIASSCTRMFFSSANVKSFGRRNRRGSSHNPRVFVQIKLNWLSSIHRIFKICFTDNIYVF